MASEINSQQRVGFLLGNFPPINEIYDPDSGRALLIPGLPLPPPAPKENSIRIGIIDSGVMASHPQLRTLIVAEKAFAGSDPTDKIGHGTLMALQLVRTWADTEIQQLLGEKFSYPAIVSARVTDDFGVPSVEAVIAAIDWVVAEGVKTVNLSLGFRGEDAEYSDLCKAIVKHSDIIFNAAAGNFGPEVKVFPAACSLKNLISVGELREGVPTPHSGLSQVYAPTDLPFFTPWQYHLDLGKKAAKAGHYSQARIEFQASLLAEKNTEALFQLALLDIYENNLTSAAERLIAALDMEPKLATLRTHLGAVRFLQGRFKDAEMLLREALSLDASDQMAYFNLGQTLLNLGRSAEALATFEKLRRLNPDYPRLDAAIAEASARLNKDSQE